MMMITKLESNEVFVFGSNGQGFHGAGAAGYAMRGEAKNNWRQDEAFLRAMKAPVGSPERVGKWAIFGVPRGLQQGHEGKSYAIQTIERPGKRCSTSRRDICIQLIQLWKVAEYYYNLTFLMTPIGCGYSGYTPAEMQEVIDWVISKHGLPDNIKLASI